MAEPEIYTDITNIARGGAVELFNDELQRVLANILDLNTEAKAVRTITLTVKIKPNEDRDMSLASVDVKSKLAPVKGTATVLYIGKIKGEPVAMEHNPRQPELPLDNVTDIKREAK